MTTEFHLKGKPINIKDEYLTETKDGIVFFYKNRRLHREAGPAAFLEKEKEQYLNLGDEYLYKPNQSNKYIIDEISLLIIEVSILKGDNIYYLEGKEYSKEEFTFILEKKMLYDELNEETSNSKIKEKKLKV